MLGATVCDGLAVAEGDGLIDGDAEGVEVGERLADGLGVDVHAPSSRMRTMGSTARRANRFIHPSLLSPSKATRDPDTGMHWGCSVMG